MKIYEENTLLPK